jgi:CARDB protein
MGRAITGLVATALCVAAVGGAAALRPDLAVVVASVTQRGDTIRVRDVVRNRGDGVAAESQVGYYLGGQRIGARSVRRLATGAASRGSKSLTIPAALRPGPYPVRVCADDRRRVAETNEANNCRAAGRVRARDGMPPTFAGIVQATFCAPGPIGHDRTSRYVLRWDEARDAVTATAALVYDIYEATSPGGERFASPTYTSIPGATSFTTPPLPTDTGRYYVVRARDRAGNRDANAVERQAVSICV